MRLATQFSRLLCAATFLVLACSGDDTTDSLPPQADGVTPTPATPIDNKSQGTFLPTVVPLRPGTQAQPLSKADYERLVRQLGAEYLQSVEEADVTGDGVPEALVVGAFGMHGRLVIVYSGSIPIFATIGISTSPKALAGGFNLYQALSFYDEGFCCPSWFYVGRYEWRTDHFELTSVDARHAVEVHSLPRPADLALEETRAVLSYYLRIGGGRLDQAHQLLSRRLRAEQPMEAWLRGFATSAGVSLRGVKVRPEDNRLIEVQFSTVDRIMGGQLTTTEYAGTWEVIFEDGGWRLDRAAIQACRTPAPTGPRC